MKIRDIFENIDKSTENEEYIDINDLEQEFGCSFNGSLYGTDRFKSYWIGKWYCSDQYVGHRAYFFDDKPVAISYQSGRKSSESFEWFSLELANKVRDYLLTLKDEDEENSNYSFCDLDDEVDDGYQILFNAQVPNNQKATFNNQDIEIIEYLGDKGYNNTSSEVMIKLLNEETKKVEVSELFFKYNFKNN